MPVLVNGKRRPQQALVNVQQTIGRGSAGETYAGNGGQYRGALNTGFKLGDGGFLNLTLDYLKRMETNRTGPDSLRVDPPRVTQRLGELYAFGGATQRDGNTRG